MGRVGAEEVYRSSIDIGSYSGDGYGSFEVMVSDNASNVGRVVGYIKNGGSYYGNSVYISTGIRAISFNVYDLDSNSVIWSNDEEVGVVISHDEQARWWLISEEGVIPSAGNLLWSEVRQRGTDSRMV